MRRLGQFIAIAALAAAVTGCVHGTRYMSDPLSPSLVLGQMTQFGPDCTDGLGAGSGDFGPACFQTRNDHLLGAMNRLPSGGFQAVEVRQTEHLRTINGRPRDYTTTTIRSLQQQTNLGVDLPLSVP